MFYRKEKGVWGFFIDPDTFRLEKLWGKEIKEKTIVITKKMEYIVDIDRRVVNTEFFMVIDDNLISKKKNDIKSFMSDKAVQFMDRYGMYPPNTSIKKIYKTSYRLLYTVDEYLEFEMTIKKDMVNKPLDEYFAVIDEFDEKRLPEKKTEDTKEDKPEQKTETWEVEGSTKKDGSRNIYTVRNTGNSWSCSCPHFVYRNKECKHIKSIRE